MRDTCLLLLPDIPESPRERNTVRYVLSSVIKMSGAFLCLQVSRGLTYEAPRNALLIIKLLIIGFLLIGYLVIRFLAFFTFRILAFHFPVMGFLTNGDIRLTH